MATTIDEGFREFLRRLTPSPTESDAAKRHRASIEDCLKRSLEITRHFRTGSFGHGTSIRAFSDVDFFASIPPKHQRDNSDSMLRVMRDILNIRFPNTGVCVRTPAVLVPFGTDGNESTEVTPAYIDRKDSLGNSVYKIPDGSGGWKDASPEAHNLYVDCVDDKLLKRVKPLIRFIKAWKYLQDVPISSFYLELFTAKYSNNEKTIIYSIDIFRIMMDLYSSNLNSIFDPMGISGYVRSCSSDNKKQDAMAKLNTAIGRVKNAWNAEEFKDIPMAFFYWDKVFNGNFPSYG